MALETAKRTAFEKSSRKASQVWNWKTLSDSLRPKTKSADEIILQLQKCFLKDLDPEKAQKLLKSADCSVFQEKAEFDDFGYKRILLEENEKFNLVLMCWPEGSATSIHDHTGSECIMKCLAGKIRETRYKWPVKKRQSLEKIREEDLKKNEVSGINDEEGLHLIENPSTAERAISLHLYYPPLSECLEVQMTETTPVAPVAAKEELPSKEEAQEELVYEFENYKNQFYENFQKLKDLKILNDGSLVCVSNEKLVRFPCNISALSIAIPKLNQEFYQAKKKMVASGFMHSSVDLQLPDFRQEGTSSAETALRIIFQFVFKGKFNVSPMSIKNVAVLAAYLKIDAILESLPAAAEQIGDADFDIEEYKKIASSLGAMKIVGLDKFVNVFGGGQKNQKTTNKRAADVGKAVKKNEPVQKKSKPLPSEPTIDENSFVIKDEVPPEQMIAEKDSEEEKKVEEVTQQQEKSGDTEVSQETVTNDVSKESAEE